MHTYTFETERLLLRPLTQADAEAEFVWCSDPVVNRYLPYSLYTRIEDLRTYLAKVEKTTSTYHFGFVRKADGLLIGAGDIGPDEDTPGAWCMGYNFRRDAWNLGYGTEAAQGMIDFAYQTFAVRSFTAAHALANPASGKVMEHCGMVPDHAMTYGKFDGSEVFPAMAYYLRLDKQGKARRYRFSPMSEEQYRAYLSWQYPAPYEFYNTPPHAWEESLQAYRKASGGWFAALDDKGRMAGMCEFSFQGDAMEISLGLCPENTGCGAGEQFTRACLAFGRQHYAWWLKPVTLRVADFNLRARKVYERVGFCETGRQEALSFGEPVTFIKMELKP